MKFSLGISTDADPETFPVLKDINITFLPKGNYKKTAEKAMILIKKQRNIFLDLSNIFLISNQWLLLYF